MNIYNRLMDLDIFILYKTENSDGSFSDHIFEMSDDSDYGIKYLNEQINTIFKIELRKIKLKNISS